MQFEKNYNRTSISHEFQYSGSKYKVDILSSVCLLPFPLSKVVSRFIVVKSWKVYSNSILLKMYSERII